MLMYGGNIDESIDYVFSVFSFPGPLYTWNNSIKSPWVVHIDFLIKIHEWIAPTPDENNIVNFYCMKKPSF